MTDPEAAGPDHAGGKSEEALEVSPVAYNESEQVSPGQAAPLDSAVGGLTVLPDVDEPPPGTLPPPAAQCPAAPSSAAMNLSPAKRRRDDQIRIRESRTGVSTPAAPGALELPSAAAHAACLEGVALGCSRGGINQKWIADNDYAYRTCYGGEWWQPAVSNLIHRKYRGQDVA